MRKSVWMAQLERALSREGMTGAEKRTVMNYYEEMYQDKRDDGLSEEEIIKEFGFPEDVAQNVRESEDMSNNNAPRGSKNADVECEADGYELHSAKLYRPSPSFEAQSYATSAPQGANAFSNAPPYNSGANGPNKGGRTNNAGRNDGSDAISVLLGIVRGVCFIVLAIVLFAVAVALSVSGIAVIICSFLVIGVSAGAWLIAFGIGIILLAVGCLIFAGALKYSSARGSRVFDRR